MIKQERQKKGLKVLSSAAAGLVLTVAAGNLQAMLMASDFDVFVDMPEVNGTSFGLSAQLGITIDSATKTTWTLLNTAPATSPPPTDPGNGVGDAPRIDALFFSLAGFPPLTASSISDSIKVSVSDVDSGWDLLDSGGNSGGAGANFSLVEDSTVSTSRLGSGLQLVFILEAIDGPDDGTDIDFTWTIDRFLNASDSTGGNGGFQVAASFQSVGPTANDSGIVAGDYVEGGGGGQQQIPEPGTLLLFALGLVGLGFRSRA